MGYSDGKSVSFAYNSNGSLVEMNDWNGKTTFELDLLDRIAKVKDHNNKTTSYQYDSVGNKTEMTYPDSTTVSYEYDSLGRMTGVTDAESEKTVYAYDAAGQLIKQAYPNGWTESYDYDAAGQLIRTLTDAPVPQTWNGPARWVVYDPQGNILEETNLNEHYVYSYDALNRLVSANADTYEYDSLGNLIRANEDGALTSYTYNRLNQQVSKVVNGVTQTNTFDKRGNLVKVSDGSTYVYDATNRMVKGTNASGEESVYKYNGLGYLAETLDYTSPLKNVIMDSDTKNVYGLDKVSVTVGGEKLFVHQDRLGSTRILTNGNGEIKGIVNYDPWGKPTVNKAVSIGGTAEKLSQNYTGHAYDEILGLYFAQARMYDPANSHWLAKDPINDGLNWYAYCYENPIKYVDPDGLKPYTRNVMERNGKPIQNLFTLHISSQGEDFTKAILSAIPWYGVGTIYTIGQGLYNKAIGYHEFGPNASNMLSELINDTSNLYKSTLPKHIQQTSKLLKILELAGRTLDIVELLSYPLDWVRTQNYQVEEAINNQFGKDVWHSKTRTAVENKFDYAFSEMKALINKGEVEVKTAVEYFGADAFKFSNGKSKPWIIGKDPLTGKTRVFRKNDYYFFALSGSGQIAKQEKFIRDQVGW